MAYNVTGFETANSAVDLFDSAFKMNNYNGEPMYFLGYSVIFLLFVGMFMLMKRQNEYLVSFIATSFVTSIVGGLLGYMGYVQWIGALIPLLLFLVSTAYFLWTKEN